MANELTEALRQYDAPGYREGCDLHDDAARLADAVRREISDEPLTPELLEENGWCRASSNKEWTRGGCVVWKSVFTGMFVFDVDGGAIDVTTIGQVRTLLRCFAESQQ